MLEHQRCQRAALLVPGECLGKVDVRDAIARKHAEGFCEHVLRLFHAARRAKRLPLRVIAQRNPQRFAIAKSVFDAVGQIAQGDAHVCYAVRLQVQERVFQDGLVQKTNHGLGTVACERPQPRTFAAGHDDGFHPVSLQKNTILLCCNIVLLVKKVFLTSRWTGEQALPPLPPSPVSAKILRIFGRGNCKETIFALENGIFRRKNRPVPAVHAAGDD